MEEKIYPINDKIYARVMSYDTLEPANCKIEAHDKYIDIQGTIIGAEGISVYNRELIPAITEYNQEKDVTLFDATDKDIIAHTHNIHGYFTMLFFNEAHRPKERVVGYRNVKKFVIKVHNSCIFQ